MNGSQVPGSGFRVRRPETRTRNSELGTRNFLMFNGAFRERVRNSWVEMRENLTRSTLQSLGVILGVASVLGGFSISDSMRKRSMELYVKMGGLDKLNVRQSAVVKEGAPTALQMANLGLRTLDADEGEDLDIVLGQTASRSARTRGRACARPYADQERDIRGIGGDFLALDGYEIDQGRDVHDARHRLGRARSRSSAPRPSRSSFPTATRSGERSASATRPSRWWAS